METPEEFVGSNDQIHSLKGPRAKRLRLNCGGADVASSSSSSSGGGRDQDFAYSSSVSGEEISTEEEEDMANCLILLAQGVHGRRPTQFLQDGVKIERISPKRFNFDVYECKTCNRAFPSFQALGGHRASHKKPKPTATTDEPGDPQINQILPPAAAVHIPNKPAANLQAKTAAAAKIHECSICGLEFTSGQALGGHMRRHRAAVSSSQQVVATNTDHHRHHHNHSSSSSAVEATKMKGRNILGLDLNLPAPSEEDLRDTKFQFTPTPQTIVFSAPTLVDCHY